MPIEIKVNFSLSSELGDPDEVTRELALAPDFLWRKGALIMRSQRTYAESGWQIHSSCPPSAPVGEHLANLFARLQGKTSRILELFGEWEKDFNVIVYGTDRFPELYLDKKTLGQIARLEAGVDFDVYSLGPDDEDEAGG